MEVLYLTKLFWGYGFLTEALGAARLSVHR